MTRAWFCAAWLGMAMIACDDDTAPPQWGPPCGSSPGLRAFGTVPAGDAALVVDAYNCPEQELPRDVRITDPAGSTVGVTLEPLPRNTDHRLVRTEPPLVPGTYRVVTPDGRSQSLTVTEPAPLPTTLGQMTVESEPNCSIVFEVALDAESLPYLSLLGAEIHLTPGYGPEQDTHHASLIPGTLQVKGDHGTFDIAPHGWQPGQYLVELRAFIAGYDDAEILPTSAMANWSCAVE